VDRLPPPYYFAERDLSLKRNLNGIALKVKLDETLIVE